MTKKQLKQKYDEWNKENSQLYFERLAEIFNELQDLARKNGKTVYCSTNHLLKELIGTKDETKAFMLFAEYQQIEGKFEAFKSFAIKTHNFEI